MHRSRILIADDHKLVAELCQNLLETEFDVIGVVDDGSALLRAASELRPDLIIVDIAMPVLNGLDAAEQVRKMFPAIKIIFLTMNTDTDVAAEGFRRGGSGYLLKTCTASEIVTAVRDVLRGKTYLSPSLSEDKVGFLRRQDQELVEEGERLTERQREVLQLLAEGKTMTEVGDVLYITPRTVAFHKYRIMEVLGVRSNADLVKYAFRNHLIAT
jgi:DNA-binding NarL/FixJ family response regulator